MPYIRQGTESAYPTTYKIVFSLIVFELVHKRKHFSLYIGILYLVKCVVDPQGKV